MKTGNSKRNATRPKTNKMSAMGLQRKLTYLEACFNWPAYTNVNKFSEIDAILNSETYKFKSHIKLRKDRCSFFGTGSERFLKVDPLIPLDKVE